MNEKLPFEIVFNDEYIVVVNKTGSVLVVPTPKGEKYTLTSVLSAHLKEQVYPCHRLDRETSGLIIYARTPQLQEQIMRQFKFGDVKKIYLAFVRGRPKRPKGMLVEKILDKEGARHGEPAKEARTFYRVVNTKYLFSLLELQPFTGRTNQLRIQLANMGNPILGERQYAFGKDFSVNFRRLALHAAAISFIHPISQERVNLQIRLPRDMQEFLTRDFRKKT